MIKLEIIYALTIKNLCNLNIWWTIKILLVLYIANMIFRDQNKFTFYINNCINNYINQDEFN